MTDEIALRGSLRGLVRALSQGAGKSAILSAVAEDLTTRFGFSAVCLVDEAQRVVGGEANGDAGLLARAVRERRVCGAGEAVALPFRGGAMVVARPGLSLDAPVVPLLEELADALAETLAARAGRRPSLDPFRELSTHLHGGLAHCRMLFEGERPVDWIYLYVNAAFAQQTGLTDVVGRRVSEVVPGLLEKDPEIVATYARVARTRAPERFERHVRSLDMWFAVSVFSPAPLEFVAVFEVIDAVKRVETALAESEQRYQALFERAGIGMADVEFATERLLAVNQKMSEILGYSREELVGRTWSSLTHPDDLETDRRRVADLEPGGALTWEKRYLRRDGSVLWGRITVSRLPCTERGASTAVAMLEDVTERKQAELALRESDGALRASEQHLRTLLALAPVGIAEGDPHTGRWTWVNERLCALSGYSAAELRTLSVLDDLTHPDDRAATRALAAGIVEGPAGVVQTEKRYLRKDGSSAWVRVNVSPLRDDSGAVIRTLAIIEDITERRVNEAALQLHVSAFQAAANAVVITDRDGTIEIVNPAFAALTGYDEREIVGQNIRILDSGHESREFHRSMWETILAGEVWRGEFVNRRKDGSLYREEMTITPLREGGEVRRFIGIKQDVSARKRVEDDLRASEDRYRSLVDNLEDFVFATEASGAITFANRAIAGFGYRPEALLGRTVEELVHPEDRPTVVLLRGESRLPRELRLLDAAGKTRVVRMFVRPQLVGDDRVGLTWVGVDLTARRETEEQLRAAQKMEAIGRLAGGVAHDFNNLLSVILSYTDLAIADLRAEDPLRADLSEVLEAGKRAEGLTRQLLAFSRRQVLAVESIDVDVLVAGLAKMLCRLIGEDIALTIEAGEGSHPTRADRGQLEQVLMNLVVNARDAMPDGGDVRVSTANVTLDDSRAKALEIRPGTYVELAVADTGCGMDEATRERIFEPFFTTKGLGKGTGLGLSMVYGIVRQSGGAIAVESVVDRGSVFRIYLPRDEGAARSAHLDPASLAPPTGHESILVVEDEPALRALTRRVLTASGYDVHVAANAGEALLICERMGAAVRLVLTDVIMPGMNGSELARRLAPLCPAARVIFMSGYTDDEIARHQVLDDQFLRKPFDWRTLTRRVREALDRP